MDLIVSAPTNPYALVLADYGDIELTDLRDAILAELQLRLTGAPSAHTP